MTVTFTKAAKTMFVFDLVHLGWICDRDIGTCNTSFMLGTLYIFETCMCD